MQDASTKIIRFEQASPFKYAENRAETLLRPYIGITLGDLVGEHSRVLPKIYRRAKVQRIRLRFEAQHLHPYKSIQA